MSERASEILQQTFSATTLTEGWYDRIVEKNRIRRENLLDVARDYFQRKFGVNADDYITDYDEHELINAMDELNTCRQCQGLPCTKTRGGTEIIPTPVIEDGKIVIRYGTCKFARMANRQRRLERLLRGSKIPARYIGKTLSDYQVDANNADAVKFAKNALSTRQGAFLFGERGAGKTFLVSIIAQEYLNANLTVTFIKVPRLLDDLRETYNGKGTYTEAELLDEVYNVDLLILDDFGMEKPTKFAGTTLCKIIDARYDVETLTTIITSNFALEKIRADLDNAADGKNYNGSRIYDRLSEICRPILLKGTSRRNRQ